MDEITKKLSAGGVSTDIIEQLRAGLGNTFETELVTNGLKMAAEKVGIDPENLPHIDFHNIGEALQELVGKDVDGDGKTGISEAMDNVQQAVKNSYITPPGLFAKIQGFFGGK